MRKRIRPNLLLRTGMVFILPMLEYLSCKMIFKDSVIGIGFEFQGQLCACFSFKDLKKLWHKTYTISIELVEICLRK